MASAFRSRPPRCRLTCSRSWAARAARWCGWRRPVCRRPPAVVVTTDLFAALRASGPRASPRPWPAPDALAALARAQEALARAAWPNGFTDELARALAALGARKPSRASPFDRRRRSRTTPRARPGLFTSRLDVAPADVPAALRAVLASALAPAVAAYLDGRGGLAASASRSCSTASSPATRPVPSPSYPRRARPATGRSPRGAGLTEAARTRLADAARTLAAAHGPVELEWVVRGDSVTFLQLRPFRARARTAWPGAAAARRPRLALGRRPQSRPRCRRRRPGWSRWSTIAAGSACASRSSADIFSTPRRRTPRRAVAGRDPSARVCAPGAADADTSPHRCSPSQVLPGGGAGHLHDPATSRSSAACSRRRGRRARRWSRS